MHVITVTAVAFGLAVSAIATPVLNGREDGVTIPLSRRSTIPYSNESVDIHAISLHAASIRDKILRGFANYRKNTGVAHPFATPGSKLQKRGVIVPLTLREDTFWTCKISIGTPPKVFDVQIDTGSSDLFVLTHYCSPTCGDYKFWNPDSSETVKGVGAGFELIFGDGTIVYGVQFIDKVAIAGYTAYPQTIGAATEYYSPLRNHVAHADGLLGLAFSSISQYPAATLFETLISQKMIFNPTLSFKLSPYGGAEMYIGGANSNLYKGNIAYTRVTHPGFWEVAMDDIRVDGKKVLEDIPIIIDTGSNYILGDWERVSALHSRLGGTPIEHAGFGYYYLPCDSFPTVSLTFGGRSFEISPDVLRLGPVHDDWINCFSGIVASDSSISFWNLGNIFLQNVYTVFDYSTFQVGFADLVADDPTL